MSISLRRKERKVKTSTNASSWRKNRRNQAQADVSQDVTATKFQIYFFLLLFFRKRLLHWSPFAAPPFPCPYNELRKSSKSCSLRQRQKSEYISSLSTSQNRHTTTHKYHRPSHIPAVRRRGRRRLRSRSRWRIRSMLSHNDSVLYHVRVRLQMA